METETRSATAGQRPRQGWRGLRIELFDDGGLATLSQHARNVLTGTAIIAAGVYAANHIGDGHLHGMWKVHLAGYGVAVVGVLLLVLNLLDGLRRLAKRRHPLLLRAVVILVYVALSIRLTQVVIYFRAAT